MPTIRSEAAANAALDPGSSYNPRWLEPSPYTRRRTDPKPPLWLRIVRRIYLWL